jgi:DNA-binding NarL/FixJ family response regulator
MGGIKVLAFDDNKRLRESLTMLFNDSEDIDLLGYYSNCNNLVEHITSHQPDVVIMDIDMPGVNGIEAVKIIRRHFPTLQILMLTVFEDDEKVFNAIKAGAGGYILKSKSPKLLLEAVHEIYNGGAPMTPNIARRVLDHYRDAPQPGKVTYNLSEREAEVLKFLVDGNPYKQIAVKMNISYETVRSHMKKIYEKLQVGSMTEAVAKAIRENFFQ